MTVANTCKHGAPARHSRERKRLIHWKPRPTAVRMCEMCATPLEKSLFFFLSPLSLRVVASSIRQRASRFGVPRALRKGEKIDPVFLRSAIQCCNLFQFHESPFARPPRGPASRRPFHFCRSLSGTALRPLIRVTSLSRLFSLHPLYQPSARRPSPSVANATLRVLSLIYLVKLSFHPLRTSFKLRVLVAQVRLILWIPHYSL